MADIPRQVFPHSSNVFVLPLLTSDPPHSFLSATFAQSKFENCELRESVTIDFLIHAEYIDLFFRTESICYNVLKLPF